MLQDEKYFKRYFNQEIPNKCIDPESKKYVPPPEFHVLRAIISSDPLKSNRIPCSTIDLLFPA